METIRIFVTDSVQANESGNNALPDVASLLREKLTTKVINASLDTVEKGIIDIANKLLPLMQKLPESNTHKVESLQVSLAIDSQGEISIVGTVSGNIQIGSGITITIVKK